ncbi:hypothetical protein ACGF3C_05670 [Micromonospora sp. NPDC047762]|uniref:hypothetical protein n=1 Tax=Micromonospora sp. NPDC047762 TaxID=3364255 RepID=UPI0037123B7A
MTILQTDRQTELPIEKAAQKRLLTVRRFVIGAACLAGASAINNRTGDIALSTAAVPVLHGFLSHWIVE